jgi:hypothetical protein
MIDDLRDAANTLMVREDEPELSVFGYVLVALMAVGAVIQLLSWFTQFLLWVVS